MYDCMFRQFKRCEFQFYLDSSNALTFNSTLTVPMSSTSPYLDRSNVVTSFSCWTLRFVEPFAFLLNPSLSCWTLRFVEPFAFLLNPSLSCWTLRFVEPFAFLLNPSLSCWTLCFFEPFVLLNPSLVHQQNEGFNKKAKSFRFKLFPLDRN